MLLHEYITKNSQSENEQETRRKISYLYGDRFDYEEFKASLRPINDKKYIQEKYFE